MPERLWWGPAGPQGPRATVASRLPMGTLAEQRPWTKEHHRKPKKHSQPWYWPHGEPRADGSYERHQLGFEEYEQPDDVTNDVEALSDEDEMVREKASTALFKNRELEFSSALVEQLLQCIYDDNHIVRLNSAMTLRRLCDMGFKWEIDPYFARLSQAVELNTTDSGDKAKVIQAIGRIGYPMADYVCRLTYHADHEDERVRLALAEAFGIVGIEAELGRVRGALRKLVRDDSPSVRAAAMASLETRPYRAPQWILDSLGKGRKAKKAKSKFRKRHRAKTVKMTCKPYR